MNFLSRWNISLWLAGWGLLVPELYQLVAWFSSYTGRPPPPRDLTLTKQNKKNKTKQIRYESLQKPWPSELQWILEYPKIRESGFSADPSCPTALFSSSLMFHFTLSTTSRSVCKRSLGRKIEITLFFYNLLRILVKSFSPKGNSKTYCLQWYLGIINDLSNPNLRTIFSNEPPFIVPERSFHSTMYLP